MLDEDLCGRDWEPWIDEMKAGELPVEMGARAMRAVLDFLKTKTKAEIHARSVTDKLLIAPRTMPRICSPIRNCSPVTSGLT